MGLCDGLVVSFFLCFSPLLVFFLRFLHPLLRQGKEEKRRGKRED